MSENSGAGKISEIRERQRNAAIPQNKCRYCEEARLEFVAAAQAHAGDDIAYLLGRVEELEKQLSRIADYDVSMMPTVGPFGYEQAVIRDMKRLAALPSGAVGEEHKP